MSAALAVDPPPDGGYPVENTAEGEDALFSLLPTNLGGNTAVGCQALYSNTTGSDNTAVGDEALYVSTAGSANTALGSWALHENTTATENTAIGGFALVNNITGESNVVIGFEARETQSSGFGNVVIGVRGSGGGSDNVAISDRAMGNTDKGDENVALSESALSYCTGSHNIALGTVAGGQLSTGSHNIDIGNLGRSDDERTIRIGNKTVHLRSRETVDASRWVNEIQGERSYLQKDDFAAGQNRYRQTGSKAKPSLRSARRTRSAFSGDLGRKISTSWVVSG